jgi:hypothetical protein
LAGRTRDGTVLGAIALEEVAGKLAAESASRGHSIFLEV